MKMKDLQATIHFNGQDYPTNNITIEQSIDSAPIITATTNLNQDFCTTSATASISSTNISTTDYTYNYPSNSGTSVLTYINDAITWTYPDYATKDDVKQLIKQEKEKEKTMNDFSFGPFNTSDIRLSPFGMALKNKAGKWVSYNKESKRLMDVDILNLNIASSKVFYKIPRATKDVTAGDIILHNGTLMFVEDINDGRFLVINPYEGTEIVILPASSPFGFDYITVIVSLTSFLPNATSDNPFGNILPFLMMSNDNNNNNNLGLLLALSQGGDFKDMDPMMLMMLSSGNMGDFLMYQMMMETNYKRKVRDIKRAEEFRKVFSKDDIDE